MRSQNSSIRLVLVGPPFEALQELFDQLTFGGTTDWTCPVGGNNYLIPVLQVNYRTSTPPRSGVVSVSCRWDYAVTVRNSYERLVILVAPDAADRIPESLTNTTEIFGGIRRKTRRRWLDTVVWKYLVTLISNRVGIGSDQVLFALREVAKQSAHLVPSVRDRIVWETADVLLSGSPGLSALDSLALASGFPAIGAGGGTLEEAAKTLERLAREAGRQGITAALNSLAGTATITSNGLEPAVEQLRLHLVGNAPSGMSFQEAPAIYYRPVRPTPAWWSQLTQSVLAAALDELSPPKPGRLVLACENPLVVLGGFSVVANSVQLWAQPPARTALASASFSRGARGAATALAADAADPCRATDPAPPAHDRPLSYQASAPGFNDGTIRVISLDSFACGALVAVSNADDNPFPTRTARQPDWSQQILLPRSGNSDVTVFHASGAASVEIARQDSAEAPWIRPVALGSFATSVAFDIEDGSRYLVRLLASDGTERARLSVAFVVEEAGDTPATRFQALVATHQQKGQRVGQARVVDTPLRRLEEAYLESPDSWKPVLACWPSEQLPQLQVDWTDPRLGSAFPQLDPRPTLTIPPAVQQAREAIRNYLAALRQPVGEIWFEATALRPLVEVYLREYQQWLTQSPIQATWLDSIAVHAAERNEQVGGFLAYPEPSVILLSPLHPLRLGWHCCSQWLLAEALSKPCPAAGLLDPSACPDLGLWSLQQGPDLVPRAFLSVACDEPHWAVLLNRTYLGQPAIDLALRRLALLGLATRGLPGGFSPSQASDSVEEVVKLLPCRTTLRVGLVGSPDESSGSAKGLLSWCSRNCDEDQAEAVEPANVEVFDTRGAREPSAEQLATLAEETSERIRWFSVPQLPADVPQDLVLLDQLGASGPKGDSGGSRTPTGLAALVRVRTREDSRNAMQIKESRVGKPMAPGTGLPGVLAQLCIEFETLAGRDASTSHFTFQPVQQAIGNRLTQATYVAVTSTQIDPACIIRGTRNQRGYLWNYELPGALGGTEERSGYYLIASPTEEMLRAIDRSAQLVATTPPPVQNLLDEISRRGIPILKRLAAGGSQARGELGLLLAVRLLQDAFRANAPRLGLPVWRGRCIHLILAVDPYETPFEGLRQALRLQTSEQRPDLLVFAVRLPAGQEKIRVKITPVEVKFRQNQMPGNDLRNALAQAANLGLLADRIWVQSLPNTLWTVCTGALLGQMLELAFRIYADPTVHGKLPESWTDVQETVIAAVLSQEAEITVNAKGRLLVFDQSPQSSCLDVDADNRFDTAVICRQDASTLLTGSGALSAQAEQTLALLDFSFPDCGASEASLTASGQADAATATPHTQPPAPAGELSPLPPTEVAAPAVASLEPSPEAPAGSSPVPAAVRQAVRAAFQGFIGNEAAVRRIENDLLRALIERPPHLSKNFLFTGQPSTGKTEISRRIAAALQLPFVKLDGRGLRSRERLFALTDGELTQQGLAPAQVGSQAGLPVLQYPSLIVFIDEVHLVPRPIQESLLTMLEAADRTVTLADRVAVMDLATFLFATTRASDLDPAFRSRCSEVQLKEYTREQVAAIVGLHFPEDWPESIYLAIAQLGRRVPRIALELAQELETAITVAEDTSLTVTHHLEQVRQARELDPLGLTLTDLEYLAVLARENRPIGEQPLVNLLGTVDRDRVVDEIEPFLRSLGFIRFGARGREITEEGRDYLMERTRNGALG
ncbi:MAG: AAA family ATPase [Acidobacteriota bacterium]